MLLPNKRGTHIKIDNNLVYSGAATFEPIIANPTQDQCTKLLGFTPKDEPVYITDRDGYENNRVTIYGRVKEINKIVKLVIWCKNKTRVSTGGKTMFINNVGETGQAVDLETILSNPKVNFLGKNLRPCFEGENTLIEFLIKLGQLDTSHVIDGEENNINLENSIFEQAGVDELNEFIASMAKEKAAIGVLLVVKDDIYQEVAISPYNPSFFYEGTPISAKYVSNLIGTKYKVQSPDFSLQVWKPTKALGGTTGVKSGYSAAYTEAEDLEGYEPEED